MEVDWEIDDNDANGEAIAAAATVAAAGPAASPTDGSGDSALQACCRLLTLTALLGLIGTTEGAVGEAGGGRSRARHTVDVAPAELR